MLQPQSRQNPNNVVPFQPEVPGPEEWLTEQGLMPAQNPDNTPASERVALVDKFLSDAQRSNSRQAAERYWREADRLVDGMHWSADGAMTKYRLEFQFVANVIYSIKEKLVSMLIEGVPELEYLERSPNHIDIATQLDNFFQHEFERKNWMAALIIALDEAVKHRVGWLKVFWDPRDDGGRGAIRVEPVSNYDLFISEGAMIRDGVLEAKSVIHRMEMTRNKIIGQWKVDPSGEYQQHVNVGRRDQSRPFLDMVRQEAESSRGSMNSAESRSPRYHERKDVEQVYECHYFDDSLVKTQGIDETEDPQLQYPTGRILVTCNGHLLADVKNPSGFCSFVPFVIDPSIDSIYGPSVINQLAGMQMALNKCISQMIEHTERCSNPIMRISSLTQGLNSDSNLGKPGSKVITMEHEGGVDWIAPPSLGIEVKDLIPMMVEFMEIISGVHEVSQGQTSSEARSGIAIQHLQAAAATRTSLKSINYDQGYKTFARNIASLMIDFENKDRQYRFIDEDLMMEQHGTFNAETLVTPTRQEAIAEIYAQMDQLKMQFMNIQRYRSGEEAQMLMEYYAAEYQALQRKVYEIQAMPAHDLVSFDVRIQTGTRGMTQAARSSQGMILHELDIITDASLLKILKVPNAWKMLKLKADENKAIAEAQAQRAQEEIALQRQTIDAEHEDAMELAELEGEFKIIVAKIQAALRKEQMRQSNSASKSKSTSKSKSKSKKK